MVHEFDGVGGGGEHGAGFGLVDARSGDGHGGWQDGGHKNGSATGRIGFVVALWVVGVLGLEFDGGGRFGLVGIVGNEERF